VHIVFIIRSAILPNLIHPIPLGSIQQQQQHTFKGPLSGTTCVSQYQKDKTNLDVTEARDSAVSACRLYSSAAVSGGCRVKSTPFDTNSHWRAVMRAATPAEHFHFFFPKNQQALGN